VTFEGLHHVTALAGEAQGNIDFYTRSLGLRLVKRTVNYDDPGTHHFYYGGRNGAPGTLLTFFPWGHTRTPRKGAGQAVAVAYTVAADALERWSRATGAAVRERFGERVIAGEDPDGMALELSAADAPRLEGVTLCETDGGRADALLHDVLGLARAGREGNRARFTVPGGGFIDVLHEPAAEAGKMGAGIIHHVALRVPDEAAQLAWRARLMEAGLRVSHVRDRTYFQSIYFRPPGGVLFEIATAGPGFTIDESEDDLGRRLCLPPWLEPHRAGIERRLSPVVIE
jgi:glyoxalase family protein